MPRRRPKIEGPVPEDFYKLKKACTICKEVKFFSDFYWDRRSKTSTGSSYCKKCFKLDTAEHQRHRVRRDPEKARTKNMVHRLKQKFKLSVADYEKMLNEQNGVCAICLEPESQKIHGRVKRLSVDHNHTTGKVRGLLCGRCNSAIGLLDERQALFRMAECYLVKYAKT